jgi:hypothetical protein
MRNKEIKDIVYSNVYQNASTGYVLTPSELSFEMISILPNSVFESDSTTFLDPICKSGTFLFEVIEKLYDQGHSVNNIQNRIYTIDSNSHSLNVAESFIKKILNKESGSFKVDYKHEFVERFHNRLISVVSKGKYTTFDDFLSIIILDKKEKYLMELLKNNISSFIEKYEKVSKLESKLFGEVFTPRQLIDEMLDTLPENVWRNPDIKWLDPAVGIGNFPAAILDRLMVGLDTIIPNEDERRKYILEEMLYMCDISTKNLFLLYMLFDKNNEFKLNVYRGSFLDESGDRISDGFIKFLDNKKLDIKKTNWVIVGNPPYNWSDGSSQRKNNRENLWTRFIVHSFNFLNEGGYLCFVTPKSWMSPSADFGKIHIIKDIFAKYNPIHVNIDKCSRYFNVGSSFSYYLLQKSKNNKNTKVETLDGTFNFDFSDVDQLPTLFNDLSISISSKFFNYDEKFEFKQRGINTRGEEFHKSPVGEYINPCFHTKSKSLLYSRFISDDFNKRKVLICLSGLYEAIVDVDGQISQTGMSCVHLLNDDDDDFNINAQLNSKAYRFIMNHLYKYNGWVNMKCVYKLPFIKYDGCLNDEEIFKIFKLTQEEIELIEKTIKD